MRSSRRQSKGMQIIFAAITIMILLSMLLSLFAVNITPVVTPTPTVSNIFLVP